MRPLFDRLVSHSANDETGRRLVTTRTVILVQQQRVATARYSHTQPVFNSVVPCAFDVFSVNLRPFLFVKNKHIAFQAGLNIIIVAAGRILSPSLHTGLLLLLIDDRTGLPVRASVATPSRLVLISDVSQANVRYIRSDQEWTATIMSQPFVRMHSSCSNESDIRCANVPTKCY